MYGALKGSSLTLLPLSGGVRNCISSATKNGGHRRQGRKERWPVRRGSFGDILRGTTSGGEGDDCVEYTHTSTRPSE